MTFNSMPELAPRTEAIEREVLISLFSNASNEIRSTPGLHLIEIDDALLLASVEDPSILLNRVQGLGTQQQISPATIQKIVDTCTELEVRNFFLHLYLSELSKESRKQLASSGLIPARSWMRFIRDVSPPRTTSTELRIEKLRAEHANEFAEVVCHAFDMTTAAVPLIAALINDPRWHLYASFDGDSAASTSSLKPERRSKVIHRTHITSLLSTVSPRCGCDRTSDRRSFK